MSPLHAVTHLAPHKYLSEEEHESPGRQGGVSPRTTRERSRNAGAQRAREPVTKATAVKPREDRTKLGLQTLRGSQTPQPCPPLPPLVYCQTADVICACVSGKCHKQAIVPVSLWPQIQQCLHLCSPRHMAPRQDRTLGPR